MELVDVRSNLEILSWRKCVERPEVRDRLRSVPVHPWAGGEKSHWMWIRATSITGRRIRNGR